MHHRSMVPKSTKSYHHDRRKSQPHVPCSSQLLPINPKPHFEKHRKSSAEKHNSDMRRHGSVELSNLYPHHRHSTDGSSRRYLLGDAPFIDWVSESDKIPSMVTSQHDAKVKHMLINRDNNDSSALRSSSSVRSRNQVFLFFFNQRSNIKRRLKIH